MIGPVEAWAVGDVWFGARVRAVRVRAGLRQSDVAELANVSPATVSRVERGHLDRLSMHAIRAVAAALEIQTTLVPRWRGGELDRLVNARHAALHEAIARALGAHRGWVVTPEVSFSIYGERGVIDVLAWHAVKRALLVCELKSDIVDPQELVGTLDRKRRLGRTIARDRGLDPATISCWVIVAESSANRRRVDAHRAFFANAYPTDGRAMRAWLRRPRGEVAALSFLPIVHPRTGKHVRSTRQRVRRAASRSS
jgi:transcriptional regulator with XRE-family HTH domain